MGLTRGLPSAYQGVLAPHQVEADISPGIARWIWPPQAKPSRRKEAPALLSMQWLYACEPLQGLRALELTADQQGQAHGRHNDRNGEFVHRERAFKRALPPAQFIYREFDDDWCEQDHKGGDVFEMCASWPWTASAQVQRERKALQYNERRNQQKTDHAG